MMTSRSNLDCLRLGFARIPAASQGGGFLASLSGMPIDAAMKMASFKYKP
jgi:hypothetical protein